MKQYFMNKSLTYFKSLYKAIKDDIGNNINAMPLSTSLFFSKLSYFSENFIDKILLKKCNAKKLIHYSNSNTRAFLVEFDDVILISFKGVQIQCYHDWKTLFSFAKTRYYHIDAHTGFVHALKNISDMILNDLQEVDKNKRIIYTGHSLGGALATLFAFEHKPDEITTFGSPKVSSGDNFQKYFKNVQYNRVRTKHDIVAKVPFSWPLKYEHIKDGIVMESELNIRTPLLPHRLEKYLETVLHLETDLIKGK